MNKTALSLTVFLCCGLANAAWASDLNCPASVEVKQEILGTPSAWEAVGGVFKVPLDRVAFYLKHPRLGGSLVPDATRRRQGEAREIWVFVSKADDEFWLGCIYQDTKVVLARKLESGVSKCEVRYATLPSGSRLHVTQVSCE